MGFVGHAYDATADADVGQPPGRALVLLAAGLLCATLLVAGCGDPVGGGA